MKTLCKFQLARPTAKQRCLDYIGQLEPVERDGKFIRVTIAEATHDRSLEQNALSHKWYGEIGQHTGETPEEVKARCKLEYGIPILRRREDFEAMYEAVLMPLDYETRLQAIKYVDVTSLMTVREMTEYLDAVQVDHGRQGIPLTMPEAA